ETGVPKDARDEIAGCQDGRVVVGGVSRATALPLTAGKIKARAAGPRLEHRQICLGRSARRAGTGACARSATSTAVATCASAEHRLRLHRQQAFADRKSTRLNSSHSQISYAVFCLKK